MITPEPFIEGTFMMQRMEGKGGWTYVVLPKEVKNPGVPFGWMKVTGCIDSYDLRQIKLMPMKGGSLFLPVKAAIRKALKKQAGDTVFVRLFPDYSAYGIPQELIDCLQLEPGAYERFRELSEGEQKRSVEWIYDAKTEETKVKRIADTIARLR